MYGIGIPGADLAPARREATKGGSMKLPACISYFFLFRDERSNTGEK